jgi:alpha-N-arabinofuranosidase
MRPWQAVLHTRKLFIGLPLIFALVSPSRGQTQVMGTSAWHAVEGRILAGKTLQDHNTFGDPDKVHPVAYTGRQLGAGGLAVVLPPCSVVVSRVR